MSQLKFGSRFSLSALSAGVLVMLLGLILATSKVERLVPIDAKFDVLFLPSGANTGDGQDEREVGEERVH